jgi:2',3'-cyclic-nucleotide 2'-phosphodiesterase (5'-nucleotidase family)
MRLTILHTNDIHGRYDRLAQIATLVARARAAADHPVLYLDGGDVEDTSARLSSLTKGLAPHRLLKAAGCDVTTAGNGTWLRYGPAAVGDHARASGLPILLANLVPIDGVRETVRLGDVGVLGLTAPFENFFSDSVDFGVTALDELDLAHRLACRLRDDGARLVVLLSHLGLERDRELAAELQGEVDVIVGAHSHDLLPAGERVGDVLIAQAGDFGEHLGRLDIADGAIEASVEPVPDDTPPHPRVVAETAAIEAELETHLSEELAVLDRPLDGAWLAELFRRRARADVGLIVEGAALIEPVPAGRLTRGLLWERCTSSANPAVTTMTGEQLRYVLAAGHHPDYASEKPQPLRGRERGRLCVSGVDDPEPAREYVVGATDFELERFGGLVPAEWRLDVRYEFPTILREAIEEELTR